MYEPLGYRPKSNREWYQKACCFPLLNNYYWAISSLEKAIDLYTEKYLDLAYSEKLCSQYQQKPRFFSLLVNKKAKFNY